MPTSTRLLDLYHQLFANDVWGDFGAYISIDSSENKNSEAQVLIRSIEVNMSVVDEFSTSDEEQLCRKAMRIGAGYVHLLSWYGDDSEKALRAANKLIHCVESHPALKSENLYNLAYYTDSIYYRAWANAKLYNVSEARREFYRLSRLCPRYRDNCMDEVSAMPDEGWRDVGMSLISTGVVSFFLALIALMMALATSLWVEPRRVIPVLLMSGGAVALGAILLLVGRFQVWIQRRAQKRV